MEHRVIEVPGGAETIFTDRDFEELIEKHISYDAAKFYRERIEALKESALSVLNEVEEVVKEIVKERRKEIED